MSRKIYWARPITSYSRTHQEALQNHINGKALLSEAEENLHVSLLKICHDFETAVYENFKRMGVEVVDPGSQKVSDDFEAWRQVSDDRKANPMPFFTELAEQCDSIALTCFDDRLISDDAPSALNRIGCGVVAEVNAWVHKHSLAGSTFNHVTSLRWDYSHNRLEVDFVRWPLSHLDAEELCNQNVVLSATNDIQTYVCLSYPQTKALLLLQGYKSRSSKHKKK